MGKSIRSKIVLVRIALLSISGMQPCFAEESFLRQTWNDGKYLATSPMRLEASDMAWFAGSLVLVGGAMTADRSVHLQLKSETSTTASTKMRKFGDTAQFVGPALGVGFWAVGECNGDSYTRDTGRLAISSLLWTLIADIGLKAVVGRQRPSSTQDDPFMFKPFKSSGAFPSGHTSTTFAAATLFAERYPTWKVAVPAYAAATAVGFSRIYADKHWTSDVVAGALMGFGVSHTIVSRHNGKTSKDNQVFYDGRTLQWVRKF